MGVCAIRKKMHVSIFSIKVGWFTAYAAGAPNTPIVRRAVTWDWKVANSYGR